MHFKKLEVKGFGKLKGLTAGLNEGMNIVCGNNESGKTSLQWFIKAVLFGLKGGRATKEGILPPAKKFKPWEGGDFTGYIEYCLEDGRTFRAGRNFENNSVRIFDSMYNDVTNDFEISRERGALFAEKHLGMNETCFEKTVFIRQMESRIDDDGSRELLNRLINVTQTGFEDVSFKGAQEALKEALKTYVGNDKTSTRPLDKVLTRLQELALIKADMLEKRESRMIAEKEMGNAISFRDNLSVRKEALAKVKELVESAIITDKNRKLLSELEELLVKINNTEQEIDLLKRKSSDFQKAREELGHFSDYNENDLDIISAEFSQLRLCEAEFNRLREEIERKKENLEKLEDEFEPFKEYGKLDQTVLDNTIEVYKEYESLRKEREKGNIEGLNKKIKSVSNKNRLMKYNLILSLILSALLLTVGIFNIHRMLGATCLIGAMIGVVATLILVTAKRAVAKELIQMMNDKNISFISVNNLHEEMNKRQKLIDETFNTVGAKGIEDFIASKTQYDSKRQYIDMLRTELTSLEIRSATYLKEYNSLTDKIRNRLIKVNIINHEVHEIKEEHISNFKNNIWKYYGQLPGINYTSQRLEDMASNLESYYKQASKLSGIDCRGKDDISEFIRKLSFQIEHDEQSIQNCLNELKTGFLNNGLSASEFTAIGKTIETHEPESLSIDYDYEYNRVSEDLNSVVIQIKEYEVILKEHSHQELELQKIEEEMEQLRNKKNLLEDINISLKLALQVLTEASAEIQRDFAPALNLKMSSIINRISSGRYQDLRADSNLLLKAISPETGEVVNAFALSGGTVDQMYLSMRIAMADLISGQKETVPLIMDEVFSQYDDERTTETFGLLKDISEQRQVIFFTCKNREVEIARNVFGPQMNLINLK